MVYFIKFQIFSHLLYFVSSRAILSTLRKNPGSCDTSLAEASFSDLRAETLDLGERAVALRMRISPNELKLRETLNADALKLVEVILERGGTCDLGWEMLRWLLVDVLLDTSPEFVIGEEQREGYTPMLDALANKVDLEKKVKALQEMNDSASLSERETQLLERLDELELTVVATAEQVHNKANFCKLAGDENAMRVLNGYAHGQLNMARTLESMMLDGHIRDPLKSEVSARFKRVYSTLQAWSVERFSFLESKVACLETEVYHQFFRKVKKLMLLGQNGTNGKENVNAVSLRQSACKLEEDLAELQSDVCASLDADEKDILGFSQLSMRLINLHRELKMCISKALDPHFKLKMQTASQTAPASIQSQPQSAPVGAVVKRRVDLQIALERVILREDATSGEIEAALRKTQNLSFDSTSSMKRSIQNARIRLEEVRQRENLNTLVLTTEDVDVRKPLVTHKTKKKKRKCRSEARPEWNFPSLEKNDACVVEGTDVEGTAVETREPPMECSFGAEVDSSPHEEVVSATQAAVDSSPEKGFEASKDQVLVDSRAPEAEAGCEAEAEASASPQMSFSLSRSSMAETIVSQDCAAPKNGFQFPSLEDRQNSDIQVLRLQNEILTAETSRLSQENAQLRETIMLLQPEGDQTPRSRTKHNREWSSPEPCQYDWPIIRPASPFQIPARQIFLDGALQGTGFLNRHVA